ncbi:hypothetical protein HYALB_00010950 [Hymenoscyphus albidus]|uniref:peptide chain release factor N(5)-glutamine methyltransferase n=1 Tax=Hymenoscyphus albidus TaxID=595503 RepID=A0A9N9LNH4_9HELO|nr:hypothetical protein HYALB_00010950 [Hymenoscyphus albidus]
MPRLPHSLLLRARKISPLLPLVLRGTRTWDSAVNELRWLREHVEQTTTTRDSLLSPHKRLRILCERRAKGEPLQYILGSQPFGELDIICEPGVLIPRPETEAYTEYLAQFINQHHVVFKTMTGASLNPSTKSTSNPLRIVDLCSGTGCIPLLLHSLLSNTFTALQIQGWDISQTAVSLARRNFRENVKRGYLNASPRISFEVVDIFSNLTSDQRASLKCDILISNPPYISNESFNHETTRSVRNWEPKLALVPNISCSYSVLPQDVFYARLVDFHFNLGQSKILLMEIGDDEQAIRVVKILMDNLKRSTGSDLQNNSIEIWRDWPGQASDQGEKQELVIEEVSVPVRGSGALRAVVSMRKSFPLNC